ncbi:PKD domain-containing protein [Actinoplanes sp. CA-131856]
MKAVLSSLLLASGLILVPAGAASAAPPDCAATTPGGPVQVTPGCVDPLYAHPVIDSEQDLTTPVTHHRVSGHFDGTDVKFTIYLPPAKQWQGRFFQYTYPTSTENAYERAVAFGAASGAYTVQTSGTGGYRHDAAAAKFAETVAAAYYRSGARRIYGYLYGPSGGSFQTVGAIENTTGVWEGAVPVVLGVPTSIPINFFVRAQARMVLRDVADRIADAVRPGGSGNPYAGLTPVQAAMLHEATSLGVPLKAWADPDYVLGLSAPDGLLGFGAVIQQLDPTYADDFWSKPGYLGTEQSALGDLVRAELARTGDRWAVALPSYYRHQIPPAGEGYDVFDSLRGRYPQRPFLVGPAIANSVAGGGTYTGRINGKVIVVDNLLDSDAYPWHADWYARRVQSPGDFRLYYNDNADHLEGPVTGAKASRIVSYDPIVEQALRDVAAWAERGVRPPQSTRYTVTDGQVHVPATAAQRRGIQPVVDLTVHGRDRVDIKAGQKVDFQARVATPPGAGKIVSAGWDFTGSGTFTKAAKGFTASHRFTKPGTYYVSFKVASTRSGHPEPFAAVENLDRVRVVVHP